MSFIPKDFDVPAKLETKRFLLRMLKVSDVVKDFDAVISSTEHLQKNKTFGPNQKWPIGLSLEQNLIDLGWHQKEFQMKTSFAYTVMKPDESQCLGCIYMEPTTKENYDVKIFLWVRQSEVESGLDEYLFEEVKKWVIEKWPFKKVAYPGREISWNDWKQLKVK